MRITCLAPDSPLPRMQRWLALAATVVGCLGAQTASAQVVRCVDPVSNRVTYTDGECARGSAATEIERRRTSEEIAADQARADAALRAKEERREQALEKRRIEAQERALDAAATPTPLQRSSNDYANSYACQQSRERYAEASDEAAERIMGSRERAENAKRQMELDCMGPDAYSRLEASRPAPTIVRQVDPYWYGPVVRPHPPRPYPVHPVQPPPRPRPPVAQCEGPHCAGTVKPPVSKPRPHPREESSQPSTSPRPAQSGLGRNCRNPGGSPC